MTRYFASVARLAPSEAPHAVGVLSDSADPSSIVAIAYSSGWLVALWRDISKTERLFFVSSVLDS
jgi:hypothetical protein